MKQIIYPNNNGSVTLIVPAEGWNVEVVARKDVPAGVP